MAENDLGEEWAEAVMEDDWREAMLAVLEKKEEKYFSTEVGDTLRKHKKEGFARIYYEKEIFTKEQASMLTREDIRKMGASTIGEVLSLKKLFGSPAHLSTEVGKLLSENNYKQYAMVFYTQQIFNIDVAVMLEPEDFNDLGITNPSEQTHLLELFTASKVERSEEPGM